MSAIGGRLREKRPVIYRFPDEVVRRLLPEWCSEQPESVDVGAVRFCPPLREIWFPGGCNLKLSGALSLIRGDVAYIYCKALFPLLRGFLSSLLNKTSEDLSFDNRILTGPGGLGLRWPRAVPDATWNAIWNLEPPPADLTDHHRSGDAPMRDFGVKGRGLVELDNVLDGIPLQEVLFQTTSDPDSPTRICWKDAGAYDAVSGAHTEHGTWHELLNAFSNRALLIPSSEMPQWEAENVVYGSWVLPSQEEVEVYRILGEKLPFFWEDDQIDAWLAGLT